MISLNFKSITDEIFALTALRAAVTASEPELLPPLLSRDNLPALRVAVAAAFSTLVARLSLFVADATLNDSVDEQLPYNSRSDMTLNIDFGEYFRSLNSGLILTIKRNLEHILALLVLEKAYLPFDTSIAVEKASEAAELISSIIAILKPAYSPSIIAPCYL